MERRKTIGGLTIVDLFVGFEMLARLSGSGFKLWHLFAQQRENVCFLPCQLGTRDMPKDEFGRLH